MDRKPPKNCDTMQKGQEIFEKYDALGPTWCFQRITEDDITSCGGRKAFINIFIEFYKKFMADPETCGLFNKNDPDSNVDADEHGKRLGLWYLARYGCGDDNEYMEYRGNLFSKFGKAHQRAMGCPHRPYDEHGRGFRIQQRNLWLGYQYEACHRLNIPESVTSKLMGLGAGYGMGFVVIDDSL